MRYIIMLLTIIFITPSIAYAGPCDASNEPGFHMVGSVICLGRVDYVNGVSLTNHIKVSSISRVSDLLVVFSGESATGSALFFGMQEGIAKIIGESASDDHRLNMVNYSGVKFNVFNGSVYFLTDAYGETGSVRLFELNNVMKKMSNSQSITPHDVRFVTKGDFMTILDKGALYNNLIISRENMRDGRGRQFFLVSADGSKEEFIGSTLSDVSVFLSKRNQ